MRLPPLLHRRHLLLASTAAIALAACGNRPPQAQALPAEARVLALGDSLTQGVGAKADEAWPSLLAERTGWDVINAGISGDTSAQALERLPDLLQEHAPALVVVSIGGNDFLRQMSAETAQANIRRICQQAKDSGAQVLLVAVPRKSLFADGAPLYGELAQQYGLVLDEDSIGELLRTPGLKSDAVHFNAQGYGALAERLHRLLQASGAL